CARDYSGSYYYPLYRFDVW
nr:immunoglobulin heavy chain junction region [Macaca mulatta]MOY18630.1 immunoglobulin heavy chain junction region [Macaca mulatta]MOY19268.1 immunoglobulin heavy chain junction region [Macaca mulatta]MOY19514.1 immunoglobulin heavy chain junction region [Macaca mulatta]MOY19931.1 immunoglobulin heavy chain junction region [Macaca mulatta]